MAEQQPFESTGNDFRDVSLSIAPFLEYGERAPLPAGVLMRGPQLGGLGRERLRLCRTVVNLCREADDPGLFDDAGLVRLVHCPMSNNTYVYDTCSEDVRTWLVQVVRQLEAPVELPILVHCKHGRDRTGVLVAVLLLILGASKTAIMQEFLLTSGAKQRHLQRALDGIRAEGGVDGYFAGRVDLEAVRGHLSSRHIRLSSRESHQKASRAISAGEDPACWCEGLLCSARRALKLDPEDAEMHAAAGWALARLGLAEEARRALEDGLRLASTRAVGRGVVRLIERELAAVAG